MVRQNILIAVLGDRDLDGHDCQAEASLHENRQERLDDLSQIILTYQRRYTGEEPAENFNVGDEVMLRTQPQSNTRRQFHAGFHPR